MEKDQNEQMQCYLNNNDRREKDEDNKSFMKYKCSWSKAMIQPKCVRYQEVRAFSSQLADTGIPGGVLFAEG